MTMEPWQQEPIIAYSQLLSKSFRQLMKRELLPDGPADPADYAHAIYHAPFVVLSHGTQADPLFRYGNRAAQELWEIPWHELIGMPSRLTAEPVAQQERQMLLERARTHGYIDDYRGIRISRTGRRFEIQNTFLWNVVDEHGTLHGQAATFSQWANV